MRVSILFLFIGLYACGQQSSNKKNTVDPNARRLNDSAMQVAMYTQDYDKAIALLEQAILIDSNYLTAYANKLSFQMQLKRFDQALQTAFKLKSQRPQSPEYYVTIGMLYHFKSDTGSSIKFLKEADALYSNIFDTMKVANPHYDMLLMGKGINLVFIGQQIEGNRVLKLLYDKSKDEIFKEMLSSYMNKSKQAILDDLIQKE